MRWAAEQLSSAVCSRILVLGMKSRRECGDPEFFFFFFRDLKRCEDIYPLLVTSSSTTGHRDGVFFFPRGKV